MGFGKISFTIQFIRFISSLCETKRLSPPTCTLGRSSPEPAPRGDYQRASPMSDANSGDLAASIPHAASFTSPRPVRHDQPRASNEEVGEPQKTPPQEEADEFASPISRPSSPAHGEPTYLGLEEGSPSSKSASVMGGEERPVPRAEVITGHGIGSSTGAGNPPKRQFSNGVRHKEGAGKYRFWVDKDSQHVVGMDGHEHGEALMEQFEVGPRAAPRASVAAPLHLQVVCVCARAAVPPALDPLAPAEGRDPKCPPRTAVHTRTPRPSSLALSTSLLSFHFLSTVLPLFSHLISPPPVDLPHSPSPRTRPLLPGGPRRDGARRGRWVRVREWRDMEGNQRGERLREENMLCVLY